MRHEQTGDVSSSRYAFQMWYMEGIDHASGHDTVHVTIHDRKTGRTVQARQGRDFDVNDKGIVFREEPRKLFDTPAPGLCAGDTGATEG